MNKFEKSFNPDGLRLPSTLLKKDLFRAATKVIPPASLYLDGYCTQVENQGSMPWCAAYSASNFAENVLWRKKGYPEQIDPERIYRRAKAIDGSPDTDGTTLDCAMQALKDLGYFGDECKVKLIPGAHFGYSAETALLDLKATLHRHGSCILGFDIDSTWFSPDKGVVKGGGKSEGGHAVTLVGYDDGGILIRNSWGMNWGHIGNAYIPNSLFKKEFMYGAVLTHCLDNFT